VGYQYPTPRKHTVAYVVFGVALILLVWAILASGSLPQLSILSITTNTSIGSGSTTSVAGDTVVVSTLSHVYGVVTKALVGLAGFIASSDNKLEVIAKSVITAVVFWGLAYLTNLLKYLLYGLAVFSVMVGVLVVLGVV
jgi:hypothetical protein